MRRWDVYRGQRFGNSRLPAVLLFAAVFLLLAFVVLFFTLPGYLVYTRDEVHLDLPFLRGETAKPEETGTEPEETLTIEEEQNLFVLQNSHLNFHLELTS